MEYNATVFIIADDLKKFVAAKKILFAHTGIELTRQEESKEDSESGTVWYYVSEKVGNVDIPDYSKSTWEAMYKEAGKMLGKSGAVIISFVDNLWEEQGKEPEYRRHTASTPEGDMLFYNTDIAADLYDDFEDFSESGLPCGYSKFEEAFTEAYGDIKFQLWKGFLNGQIPVYNESKLDVKDQYANPMKEALMAETDYHDWSNKGVTFRDRKSEPEFYARYEKYVNDDPDIVISGKTFVFTGMMDNSTAKAEPLVRAIMALGGEYRAKISGKTDYLVMESLDSAGEGKMSEAALQIDKGKPLQLITADSLLKAIDSKNS